MFFQAAHYRIHLQTLVTGITVVQMATDTSIFFYLEFKYTLIPLLAIFAIAKFSSFG